MKTSNQRRTDGGKGDLYRKVDKRKFDAGYLRVYGMKCPDCKNGTRLQVGHTTTCTRCDGIGYIEIPNNKVKCIKCCGTGRVQTARVSVIEPCPNCGGSGYVKRKVK